MANWTKLKAQRRQRQWTGKSSHRGPDQRFKDYLRGSSGKDPNLVERLFTRTERELRRSFRKGRLIDPDPPRPVRREFKHLVEDQAFVRAKPSVDQKDVIYPRVRVFEAWQSELRRQGITEFNRIAFIETEDLKLYLFFSAKKFFFREYDFNAGCVRESIVYKSHDRAKRAFEQDEILWIKKDTVP